MFESKQNPITSEQSQKSEYLGQHSSALPLMGNKNEAFSVAIYVIFMPSRCQIEAD